jgi:hypothetical protein
VTWHAKQRKYSLQKCAAYTDAFCAGDSLVFSTFLAASQDESITSRTPLQDLTVAYWICMSLAVLISLISVGYKAYEWYEQVRTRIRSARDAGIDTEPTRREALLAKIAAAKKTCTQHIVAFLVAVFEDTPMGTLTVIFTVRMYNIPIEVMLSLVTTCIMLGMKLNKLTLLKYWYAIASLLHRGGGPKSWNADAPGRRWDKMGHWKAKLNDDEMTDAMPSFDGHGTRTVADIEAELERIAQLQAHLSSVSSALQLELQQHVQAPGTTGSAEVRCHLAAARWRLASCFSPFDRRSLGHRCAKQLPSLRSPTPIPTASPMGAQPTVSEYGPTCRHRPILMTLACVQRGIEAQVRVPGPGFRVACHAAEAAPKSCLLSCCLFLLLVLAAHNLAE